MGICAANAAYISEQPAKIIFFSIISNSSQENKIGDFMKYVEARGDNYIFRQFTDVALKISSIFQHINFVRKELSHEFIPEKVPW